MIKLTDDEVIFILKTFSKALDLSVFGGLNTKERIENLKIVNRILNGERENGG